MYLYNRINEEKLDTLSMIKTTNELKRIIERNKLPLPQIVDNNEIAIVKLYTDVCFDFNESILFYFLLI